MDILVCIKPIKKELVSENDNLYEKYCINPYDLFALNAALKLKESSEKARIECLCMGTSAASEVLTRCLAMGADDGHLISDGIFAGSDTIATSYILSRFIENRKYDYVFCGCKSVDGETGQVVYGLSERLQYECVTNISKIEMYREDSLIVLQENAADNLLLKVGIGAVMVFKDFCIETSNISLISIKRANRRKINILTAEDICAAPDKCGMNGSKTQVVSMSSILDKRKCEFLFEDTERQADILYRLISEYC